MPGVPPEYFARQTPEATPEEAAAERALRETDLATDKVKQGQPPRGVLLPRIEEVMVRLSETCPPLDFPADNDREPEQLAKWARGGTSPSGRLLGAVKGCNYFVGWEYLDSALYGSPQRIVWLPPDEGQEYFVAGDKAGPNFAPKPYDNEIVFNNWGTRVVPMQVELWCNDYDDCDVLVHWVAEAIRQTNSGAVEMAGTTPVFRGGYARVALGERGVKYTIESTFVFPLAKAPFVAKRGEFVLDVLPLFADDVTPVEPDPTPANRWSGVARYDASNVVYVTFTPPLTSYTISIVPSVDETDGSIPLPYYENKTPGRFELHTSALFTGTIDWTVRPT